MDRKNGGRQAICYAHAIKANAKPPPIGYARGMETPELQSSSDKTGLILLVTGLTLAAVSGAFMKTLADELPVFLIVWLRFLGFVLLILPVVLWKTGRARVMAPVMPKVQVLRGVMMVAGSACFVIGTRTLAFADAITLIYVYPFFITLLAPFFLGEPARLLSFLGVAGGFAGVLLVAKPTAEGLVAPGAVWALASGALISGQMLMNRKLGSVTNPLLTSFWGACVAAMVLTPLVPWIWEPLTAGQAGRLAILAALAACSQTLVTFAFARAPAAELAPYTYLEIISAVVIGYVAFGTLPDALSYLGITVIIASGVLVARIQRGRITARRQPKI